MSIAVIDDGALDWAKGYGVCELGSEQRVTTETRFQAGSISKPVAAAGVLTLVAQGKLGLDADVNATLASWQVPVNELLRDRRVTLREIMSHSAGLTVHGFGGYERNAPIPALIDVLDGKPPANSPPIRVDILPATRWRYSGGGYTVMQQMLIDLLHEPFPDFMERAVLQPAHMTHSTYRQPLPDELAPLAATGHYASGARVAGKWHVYPEMAAAGLWTTASDLASFAIAIQESLGGKDGLLPTATALEMLSVQSGTWGLGFNLNGKGEQLRFSHNGRDEGFDASLVAFAEQGKGAAIMINSNNDDGFVDDVLASIAREYGWPGSAEPSPPRK
ncbi:MAG: serine hydrolase domain-containing protein [Planctomycetota bacterium]